MKQGMAHSHPSGQEPTKASAAGKVILLGEHAVVHGAPALAAPLSDVRATATVVDTAPGTGVLIDARDLERCYRLEGSDDPDAGEALRTTVRNVLIYYTGSVDHNLRVTVQSGIPMARGLGSGTAVTTAMVRALANHLGCNPSPEEVSRLVFQTERILHGTPSGIDNTVVAHERTVFFVRGNPPVFVHVAADVHLVVADTGRPSKTRDAVLDVQRRWLSARTEYEGLFRRIGALAEEAREALACGDILTLGTLMNRNHQLLRTLGVSSTELDSLVEAARHAGALGAKLTGGGRGGAMIALVQGGKQRVVEALRAAGAVATFSTVLPATAADRS